MAIRFVAIDPNTNGGESPTIWIDEDTSDIIVQGWEADETLLQQVNDAPAPNHAPGVPAGEAVVRIPARMAPAFRKALDDAYGRG